MVTGPGQGLAEWIWYMVLRLTDDIVSLSLFCRCIGDHVFHEVSQYVPAILLVVGFRDSTFRLQQNILLIVGSDDSPASLRFAMGIFGGVLLHGYILLLKMRCLKSTQSLGRLAPPNLCIWKFRMHRASIILQAA